MDRQELGRPHLTAAVSHPKSTLQSAANVPPCPHCFASDYIRDAAGDVLLRRSWCTLQDTFDFQVNALTAVIARR
jgi:hypothetical protein